MTTPKFTVGQQLRIVNPIGGQMDLLHACVTVLERHAPDLSSNGHGEYNYTFRHPEHPEHIFEYRESRFIPATITP